MSGGPGNDTVSGGAGHDVVEGGAGNDRVLGNGGNDTLRGGPGADTLEGSVGNDRMSGGGGGDTFIFSPGCGSDTVLGFGSGADRLLFEGYPTLKRFADVRALASNQGDSLFIDLPGNDDITLAGFQLADFDRSDVLFS